MKTYKYSLDRSSKKYICPDCNKKTFVLYINNSTGEPLHATVGKCDRDDNCRHHYSPKQYFADNRISFDTWRDYTPSRPKPTIITEPQPSYIDACIMRKSLTGYESNRFVRYLCRIVGDKLASDAVGRYFVGTSKYWQDSTVFWQIDLQQRIRCGKIMDYNQITGKRIKDIINGEERSRITWVHRVLMLPDFNLSQCFFGEHLLSDTSKPVAIVESEKTAIIASCYMPDFIWLSCGQKHGLTDKKCKVLKGRTVVLCPDCKAYDYWVKKAKELSEICTVSVSDLIEKHAAKHEYEAGLDIGDYLVRYSPSEFIKQPLPQKSAEISGNSHLKTKMDTLPDNPVVAAMCAKNPALSRLMETFDCEVTKDINLLAAGLPDYNSWTESELCKILKIEPQHVHGMAVRKEIYFISISGRYCRSGCTPF